MNGNTDANDDTNHGVITADDLNEGDRVTIAYDSPQSETPVEKTGEVVKTWTTGYELVADADDEDRRIKVVHSDRFLDGKGRARVTSKLRRPEVSIQGDEWTHGSELGRLVRSSTEDDAEQVEADGGRDLPTHDSVEDYAEDVDLSDLSDADLDALDDRLTELLNADPYEFPSDSALSAAFSLSSDLRDEREERDPRRDDPYFHPGDTEERFDLPVTSVEVYEEADEVRARLTLDETDLPGGRNSSEWRLRPGTEIAGAVLDYYDVDDLRVLGTAVGDTLPVVGSDLHPWGRVDRYALENDGATALDDEDDEDDDRPDKQEFLRDEVDADISRRDVRTGGGEQVEESEEWDLDPENTHNKPVSATEASGRTYAVRVEEEFADGSTHTDHYTEEQARKLLSDLQRVLDDSE